MLPVAVVVAVCVACLILVLLIAGFTYLGCFVRLKSEVCSSLECCCLAVSLRRLCRDYQLLTLFMVLLRERLLASALIPTRFGVQLMGENEETRNFEVLVVSS